MIFNHPSFKKYSANTLWLLSDKVIRMISGLIVGIWVARYLGPEQFGLLSYIFAFVGMLSPISKLGLDGIVSRDVAKDSDDIDVLLSSAYFLKFTGGIILMIISSVYMLRYKDENIYFYLTIIISLSYVFNSIEVISFYYRAKVKARFSAIARISGSIISSTIKVVFILSGFSLIYFAIANLIEAVVIFIFLGYFFKKEIHTLKLKKISFTKSRCLIEESWPLIFSGFFALIYLNVDQIMIENMLGLRAVGEYSAAARIGSALYFIPMAIGWGVQSAIVNAKKKSEAVYYNRLQLLFSLLSITGYVLVIPISYFSDEIIKIMFGNEYDGSSEILSVIIWGTLFIFVGSARGLWIINESKLKFSLFSNVSAGILNIILNYFWIKEYGLIGSAYATVLSYFVGQIGLGLIFPSIRKIFLMQIKGMLGIGIIINRRVTI